MNTALIKNAFVKTLPVMAGYVVLGIGFGILSTKNGYGFVWVLAMSLFVYAGSMQYVAVSLLAGGASLITAALTTLMVNARHLFYSISMVDRYKNAGKKKPYLIFALTDETYSLVCNGEHPDGVDEHTYYMIMSLFNQSYWVLGSVIGALLGAWITFDTTGIDFSMTALFVTVFVEQWITAKNHFSAVAGVAASVVCLIIFGADNFLIPSMILITIILSLAKKKLDKKMGGGNDEC